MVPSIKKLEVFADIFGGGSNGGFELLRPSPAMIETVSGHSNVTNHIAFGDWLESKRHLMSENL
jgi:hypothetical protein